MPEHRKTLSRSFSLGHREAVAAISPGVSAELNRLDHVRGRTQQLTLRSLNARDEFILSRAFSLGHHRNFWISAFPDFRQRERGCPRNTPKTRKGFVDFLAAKFLSRIFVPARRSMRRLGVSWATSFLCYSKRIHITP